MMKWEDPASSFCPAVSSDRHGQRLWKSPAAVYVTLVRECLGPLPFVNQIHQSVNHVAPGHSAVLLWVNLVTSQLHNPPSHMLLQAFGEHWDKGDWSQVSIDPSLMASLLGEGRCWLISTELGNKTLTRMLLLKTERTG